MTNEQLWQTALGELELTVSRANFITWLKNTSIASKKNGEVVINVPNGFTKEWLENKYNKFILKALQNNAPEIKKVKYIISQCSATKPIQKIKENYISPSFQPKKETKETSLNPRYTFNSFVVGSSNELAYAACMAVTKNLGTNYNPLFIYGGSGLGKTHLLQSIGNEVLKTDPQKKIHYTTSERFTNQLVSAISDHKTNKFKTYYRQIDILIIDDIQFLAGKEKTQEEFFHTFNALYEKNKQVVLSSDRPPKAIPTLEERLRSRFEGGMIADISYPDFETRLAILEMKSKEKNFKIPRDA
ncbi:chromosomal replication initiator protein DnaA, partial [candidate division KSB1 bacterium]